jgi:hypothetical protein
VGTKTGIFIPLYPSYPVQYLSEDEIMLIKKAQFNFYDVFQGEGWAGHTRVQIKRKPGAPPRAYYVSGVKLPHIKLVEIAKSI